MDVFILLSVHNSMMIIIRNEEEEEEDDVSYTYMLYVYKVHQMPFSARYMHRLFIMYVIIKYKVSIRTFLFHYEFAASV